jgi:hypothetical protein
MLAIGAVDDGLGRRALSCSEVKRLVDVREA